MAPPREPPPPGPAIEGEPFDADSAPGIGKRVEETVKRVLLSGVGALFMTEEGIRNLVGELKLPREVASYLIGQTERTKDEVLSAVGREVRRFLGGVQLERELRKILATTTLQVNATIRFVDKGEGNLSVEVVDHDVRTEGKPRK